ncbi:MAG: hypothetical protein ACFFAT_08795 [Promethearchaeota archaeon]
MPKWVGMPINPTGAIILYVIGIFLLLGLLIALPCVFIMTFALQTMIYYFPTMQNYVPVFFYVSLLI